jgi:APA family basic amino acid/polyamine antiporter
MAILKKSERLKKELGLLDVYALATGTTLSAGFFLLPGLAAEGAGPALPLAYVIAAVPLVPAIFSNIELATAMPRAGGIYYFIDRSLGPLMGTISGLGTWLALALKAAFALIGMGAYINLFLPNLDLFYLAIACALLFAAVNLRGARRAGRFQTTMVFGLLLLLTWFMGGIFHVRGEAFADFFRTGGGSLFATAGMVYISYVGITNVASISEEIKDPGRNLPLGVFLSLVTALLVYVVGTTVMVGVIPTDDLVGDMTPAATAAFVLAGDVGKGLMVIAALLAFSSVANAAILSASRYPLAMSRDRMVPQFFGKLNGNNVPSNGVFVTVGLILAFLIFFEPIKIAKLASAFQLLLFSLNCLAVIVMRESRLDAYDPIFRSPLYPGMQIAGIVLPFGLIVAMGWLPVLFTIGLIIASVAWYVWYAHGRVERRGAVLHVFERLGRHRFEGLDTELRGILKEKGLRSEDPFDEIVARAYVIDEINAVEFESIARRVSTLLAERVPAGAEEILGGFLRGTRIGMTPVSHGAALPHIIMPGLENPEMVLVRAHHGLRIDIPVAKGREQPVGPPVQAAFFFISPEAKPRQHLRILAQIAERVDDDGFLPLWLQAGNEQLLKELLLRTERFVSVKAEPPHRKLIGVPVAGLKLEKDCRVVMVQRGEFTFVPHTTTVINEGDRLTIIGEPEPIQVMKERFGRRKPHSKPG